MIGIPAATVEELQRTKHLQEDMGLVWVGKEARTEIPSSCGLGKWLEPLCLQMECAFSWQKLADLSQRRQGHS